jgi:hypothetical protein
MTKSNEAVTQLLVDLDVEKRRAAVDPAAVPSKTRPGIEIAVVEAKKNAAALARQLVQATIPSRLVGLFVSGENAQGFAAVVRQVGGIHLQADKLYQRLTDVVDRSLEDSRVFGVNQYGRFIEEIRAIAREVGEGPVAGPIVNVPDYAEKRLPDRASVEAFVRSAVRANPGDVLNTTLLSIDIFDQVVSGALDDAAIPVVVTGATPAEQGAIGALFARVSATTWDWPDAPNPSDLEETFRFGGAV